MSEEEKEAKESIEYWKARLYGNEGCEYIDVAQEDLRIFINLVETKEKDIESLEKYSNEQEENIIEKNNNICNLEFQIEKLQKENEKLDNDNVKWRSNNVIQLAKIDNLEKENKKLKKLMAHKNGYTKKLEEDLFENARNYVISIQKIKDKIEDLKMSGGSDEIDNTENTVRELVIEVLQDILEESEEK